MIPIVAQVDDASMAARVWAIDAQVGAAVARAEREGKQLITLWTTADNCPGCLMLKAQIVGDSSDRLHERSIVLVLEVGDVRAALVRKLKLGDATIVAPGVPMLILLSRADDGQLSFYSLSLGPLAAVDAHGDIKRVLEGVSRWVPEAAAAAIEFHRGEARTRLDAGNRFHADFAFKRAPG